MKKFSTLFFCLMLTCSMFAQVPDGTILDNFKMESIDSATEFNLYAELEENRPVYIDVSATWCGPCWNYHNGGAFKDLYETYDTPGDNTVRVIMIEGDASTNVDCLYGPTNCNNTTAGDWVTGTPYPIFDDSPVAQGPLDVSYFPTIYMVCPDRSIYEVGQAQTAALYAAKNDCPTSATHSLDAMVTTVEVPDAGETFCISQMATPAFTLVNHGNDEMTSATITLEYGGTVLETIDWTGTLPRWKSAEIQFQSFEMTQTGDMVISVSNVNNGTDEDMTNNSKTIEYKEAGKFDDAVVNIQIQTDDYGAELYWEMRQDDGTVLASGGNATVGPDGGGQFTQAPADPNAYANATLYSETASIPAASCYYFHIVDAYGDGMCCNYGNGYFRVYNASDVNLDNAIVDASNFTSDVARQDFTTSATFVAIDEVIASNSFQVFPNPTTTNINVTFEMTETVEAGLLITNTLGQVVRSIAPSKLPTGQQSLVLPVNDLPNGVYNATLQTEKGAITRKFTVLK